MATYNEITGDLIASRGTSKAFEDNYDKIFRKPKLYCPGESSDNLGHHEVTSDKSTEPPKATIH